MNSVVGSSVVLVRWPDELAELERLRAEGIPRLLMVSPGAEPPLDPDPRTDWIRSPISDDELRVRLRALELRASAVADDRPVLTDDGRLQAGGRWVAVSPTAERLLAMLIERFGAVVSMDDLLGGAWPGGTPQRGLLRVHMTKLRTVLEPLDLRIVAVRDRGYVLHWSSMTPAE
jgi:hypothetical protein